MLLMSETLTLAEIRSRLVPELHGTLLNMLRDADARSIIDGFWTDEEGGGKGYTMMASPEHQRWAQEAETKLKACFAMKATDTIPLPAALIDKTLLEALLVKRRNHREKQSQPKTPATPDTPKTNSKGKKGGAAAAGAEAPNTASSGDPDQHTTPGGHDAVA